MSAFDYLSVMISIVLGLGVAQLLTTAGVIIRERDRLKPYWLTVLWIAVLVLIHVQNWWTMFGLRDRADWSFTAFFMLLLQPIVLYLLSSLLTPNLDRETDLRAAFERQSRAFFTVFLALLCISLGKEVVLEGRLPEQDNLIAHLLFMAAGLVGAVFNRRRVHEILSPIMALALVAYIGLLFMRLD